MSIERWILLPTTMLVANLLLAWFAYRLHGQPIDGASSDVSVREHQIPDRSTEVVECPSCGAENELGYRFCRVCVEELPNSVYELGSGRNPFGQTDG